MSSNFYEQHPFHRLPGKINKSGGHHYRNLCFLSLKIFRKNTQIACAGCVRVYVCVPVQDVCVCVTLTNLTSRNCSAFISELVQLPVSVSVATGVSKDSNCCSCSSGAVKTRMKAAKLGLFWNKSRSHGNRILTFFFLHEIEIKRATEFCCYMRSYS